MDKLTEIIKKKKKKKKLCKFYGKLNSKKSIYFLIAFVFKMMISWKKV